MLLFICFLYFVAVSDIAGPSSPVSYAYSPSSTPSPPLLSSPSSPDAGPSNSFAPIAPPSSPQPGPSHAYELARPTAQRSASSSAFGRYTAFPLNRPPPVRVSNISQLLERIREGCPRIVYTGSDSEEELSVEVENETSSPTSSTVAEAGSPSTSASNPVVVDSSSDEDS